MAAHSNHHHVPKFYLDRWASKQPGDGDAGKLTYSFWAQGRLISSRIGPRGAGAEDGLYSQEFVPAARRQAVEKEFFAK